MNIKPIEPDNAGPRDVSRDHAKDGFSLTALSGLIKSCELQPRWRERADLNVAYYDGKQLTPQQEATLKAEGLEPRITNLIGRVINGVLGQEAKARSDVKVEADEEELVDVCDVMNKGLKEGQRETYADMAVSNAYASQVKAGIGWVEVSRVSDPLDYPYRVRDVHRHDIWWDWQAKDILYRDARWICRKNWFDLDELEAVMPQFKDILRQSVNNWDGFAFGDLDDQVTYRAFDNERLFATRRTEWVDGVRKRVKLYEVWYKVPATAVVLHLSPTRRVLFDENNQMHVQAVARGLVKISKSLTRQVRMALFAGPHRLMDIGTTKRNFPYVPFIAFRDDEDLSPYGLIEGMRSPQDEYNERRLRIQWMLKAKQIQVDNDALDTKFNTFEDLHNEAMRPDMMLILNGTRRNAGGVKIGNDLQMQKEQFDVMQDAKGLIQDIPGVYSTQLGNAPSGVTSGLAINSLVEQGMVSMGELNDNYRHARRAVFENLLELIADDHQTANMQVMMGSGDGRRVVVLNTFDPQSGQPINTVKDAPVRVGLEDVPATPAFRLQQQQQIATIIGALQSNPQAVAVLTPAFIESTSLPNRQQVADDIRRATGMPTAGDREAAKQMQAQQKQQQVQQQDIQQRAAQVQVAKQEADVQRTHALTQRELAQAAVLTRQAQEPAALPAPTEDDLIQQSLAEALG